MNYNPNKGILSSNYYLGQINPVDQWGEIGSSGSTVSITISSAGKKTYCSEYNLDFSDIEGLNVYKGIDNGDYVEFIKVNKVPALQGMYIIGDPGTYNIPIVKSINDDFSDNVLIGVITETTVYESIFVLMSGDQGIDWYVKTASSSPQFTLSPNSSYIPVSLVYKEIEYLESDGNAYINTEYVPKGTDIRICSKFYFGGYSNNTQWVSWVVAYVNDSTRCYRFMRRGNSSSLAIQMARRGNRSTDNNYTVSSGNIYEIDANHDRYIINGNQYTHTDYATSTENTNKLRFFDNTGVAKLRCYYFKLYKGNNLIIDMIPIRLGVAGYMYDRVSGLAFGNAGTGNFVLGNDI